MINLSQGENTPLQTGSFVPALGVGSLQGVPVLWWGVNTHPEGFGEAPLISPALSRFSLRYTTPAGAVHTFHRLPRQLFHPGASGKFKPLIRVSMSQAILALSWMGSGPRATASCKALATHPRNWANTSGIPTDSLSSSSGCHKKLSLTI